MYLCDEYILLESFMQINPFVDKRALLLCATPFKPKIRNEIYRLVCKRIIMPIDVPNDLVNLIVYVTKPNGNTRIS